MAALLSLSRLRLPELPIPPFRRLPSVKISLLVTPIPPPPALGSGFDTDKRSLYNVAVLQKASKPITDEQVAKNNMHVIESLRRVVMNLMEVADKECVSAREEAPKAPEPAAPPAAV